MAEKQEGNSRLPKRKAWMPWQRECVHSGIYHREAKNGDEVMEGRPEVINKLRQVVPAEC